MVRVVASFSVTRKTKKRNESRTTTKGSYFFTQGEVMGGVGSGKAVEPFWDKIAVSEDHNACWEWQRLRNKQGYGILKTGGGSRRAHRYVWELFNGPIPESMFVCHKCDNPPCCNPSHLFLGTHQDNMQDMMDKGRTGHPAQPGEKHRSAKLNSQQVIRIRDLYESGKYSYSELSDMFGVTSAQIGYIVTRKNWTHL